MWIKIDKDNLPNEEVLAGCFKKGTLEFGVKLVGYLSLSATGEFVVCEDERQILDFVTHYVLLGDYDFVAIE